MKKTIFIIMMITFITALFSYSFEKIYSFDKPIIQSKNGFVQLSYKNLNSYGKEGEPEIPYYNVNLLLPEGETIKEIKIEEINYYNDINDVVIKPASAQFPISRPVKNYKLKKDEKIYKSEVFPISPINDFLTSFLSGHSIGSFHIAPIKYYPLLNKISPIKSIKLKIITTKDEKAIVAQKFFRNDMFTLNRIKKLVKNIDDYWKFYRSDMAKDRDEEYDLLLITSQSLLPAFSDYINFKKSIGYFVAVKTTDEIYNEYNGVDNQEKIRNCIIDYYQNYGLKYVLLGGDADTGNQAENIVPARGLTVIIGNSDYDEHNLPSDMYYSNLDGNWNDDNDNDWGETGEIDYFSEIKIGRISADNPTEVENFTHKIILYENQPVIDDIKKALMLGEQLDDTPTYGGNYKDEIADGSDNNGYHTEAVSSFFEVTKFYERDEGWSKNNLFEQFNQNGIHLLNHLGHSSPTYNMKIGTDDINTNNFTNNGITRSYVIGYSQGCYNGSFDNWIWNGYYLDADCIAEDITDLETGEVASIANSRYGWYSPGATNSSSQYYDRQFYNSIFGEGIYKIGECNSYSKELDIMLMHDIPYYRWSAFETNLFGDPSMDIWTNTPTDFEMVSFPETINIGSSNVEVILSDLNCTVAITKDGELLGRIDGNESAIANVIFSEPIDEVCNLTVSVVGHNKNRYLGTINVVPSNTPFLSVTDFHIELYHGVDNDIVDHGETFKLYFTVKNFGNIPARYVTANLTSENPNIQMIDHVWQFACINGGEELQNETPVILKIHELCPDNEDIVLDFNFTSEDGEWSSTRNITAYAPDLSLVNTHIFSNGNDYVISGDNGFLNINLKNNGSGIANSVSATLSCYDDFVTVTNATLSEGDINANQELQFSQNFEFSISDQCPSIYHFNFNLEVIDNLGYYNVYQIPVDVGYKYTMENGAEGWSHYSMTQMPDQWHISETRSFSQTHSWKVGSPSSANYFNNLKCALETNEIDIYSNSYLSFYHWMNAEVYSGNGTQCYDGGLVEIYYNNSWQPLIPIGGYPYTTIGNNNPPFENGTGVFSGYIDWQRVYFDLSEFSGTVKFRFIFGTDGAVTNEGWYIDDVAIVSQINQILPPSNLSASIVGTTVHLQWEDNQTGIENYNIYRKDTITQYTFIGNTQDMQFNDNPEYNGFYYYVVTAVKDDEESLFSNFVYVELFTISENEDVLADKFDLLQNYPNPFNPTTTIAFNIKDENKKTTLTVYNIKGQKVITLADGKFSKGMHKVVWNGKDRFGKKVTSGMYLYKLQSGKNLKIRKMLMIK